MSKDWYPVVDYSSCEECGACVAMCSHGVYDKEKAPSPKVIFPEGCIYSCHGCGELCKTGAITYVGENTDWTPPNGEIISESWCCGSGCDSSCNC